MSLQRSQAQHEIDRLQATAGNRAVSAMLGPVVRVQRCGPEACDCTDEEREAALGAGSRRASRNVPPAPTAQRAVGDAFTSGTTPAPGPQVDEAAEPVLGLHSTGPAVARVQEQLNAVPRDEPLGVDGIFGPATEAAVVGLQADNGLEPDGLVGPQTRQVLHAVAGPAPAPPETPTPAASVEPSVTVGPSPECKYEPGEKAASKGDPGDGVPKDAALGPDPLFSGTFAIIGFEQGRATIKPNHPDFLRLVAARFRLGTPQPTHRIVRVEGMSDCVDDFGTNVGIRLARGQAGREAIRIAAPEPIPDADLGPGIAGAEGDKLTGAEFGEGGEEGRRQNRAAVFHFEMIGERPEEDFPVPDTDPFEQEGCDAPSQSWQVEPLASASAHVPPPFFVGGDALVITFTNTKTGCIHFAAFTGLGTGIGAGVGIDIPGTPDVMDTTPPFGSVFADQLSGTANLVAGTIGAGLSIEKGRLEMESGALAGQSIDLGGMELEPKLKAKVKIGVNVSLGSGRLGVLGFGVKV